MKKKNQSSNKKRSRAAGKKNKKTGTVAMGPRLENGSFRSKRNNSSTEVGINREYSFSRKEVSFSGARNPKFGNGLRVRGSDFVTALSSGAGGVLAGDILYQQDVAPALFYLTRLAQFASIFERYGVRGIRLCYVPAVPSTVAGQFIGYPDYDPADTTDVDATNRLRVAMSAMDSVMFNIYTPSVIEFLKVDPYTTLYCDGIGSDPRLTEVGIFRIICSSPVAANISIGSLYLEYDIEFYIPQLQVEISTQVDVPVGGGYQFRSCTIQDVAGVSVSIPNNSTIPLINLYNSTSFVGFPLAADSIFQVTFAASSTPTGWAGQVAFGIGQQIVAYLRTSKFPVNNGNAAGVGGTYGVGNTFWGALFQTLEEAEEQDVIFNDNPTDIITNGLQTFRNIITSSVLKNLSGVVMPLGTIIGTLISARLIPYYSLDKYVY